MANKGPLNTGPLHIGDLMQINWWRQQRNFSLLAWNIGGYVEVYKRGTRDLRIIQMIPFLWVFLEDISTSDTAALWSAEHITGGVRLSTPAARRAVHSGGCWSCVGVL